MEESPASGGTPRAGDGAPGADARSVVREAFRRYAAGETLDGLVAPGYAVDGDPAGFFPATGRTADARVTSLQGQRLAFELREFAAETSAEVAVFRGLWVHERPGGQGSAGEFWGMVRVREGLVVDVRWAGTRAELDPRFRR